MKQKMQSVKRQQRHRGVVLEDIDKKLDIVVESQVGMASRIDSLEQGQNELLGRMGTMEGHMGTMERKFDSFAEETRSSFKTVLEYLIRIDDELADIKREMAELKSTLKTKVEVKRFTALEVRVRTLEKELAALKKK